MDTDALIWFVLLALVVANCIVALQKYWDIWSGEYDNMDHYIHTGKLMEDRGRLKELVRSLHPVQCHIEHMPIYPGRCAYTSKKRRIRIRMRNDAGELYPDRVLRLVILHETAHYLSKSRGHGPEFQARFSELLGRAYALAIPVANESEVPEEYMQYCHRVHQIGA